MFMRTPRNILRHELIGLECEVVDSPNRYQIGIKGKIVDETRNTIVLETPKGYKRIEKKDRVFRVKLDDNSIVDINGSGIIARPEDRIKKKFRKW